MDDNQGVEPAVFAKNRQHHKVLYTELKTSGKLNGYLTDLNEHAETIFLVLVNRRLPMMASRNISKPILYAIGTADEQHLESSYRGSE